MDTQRTAGPWTYYEENRKRMVIAGGWEQGKFVGHLIASETTDPRSEGNLRLIAAAPDMLEALRRAYGYMSARTLSAYDLDTCSMVRAAIKKADG